MLVNRKYSPMLDEDSRHQRRTMSANEFAKLVYDISQQLKQKNVEALKYIYGVGEEDISNLKVLQILERRGVFSPSNTQGLGKVLRDIDRCDLLEMLRETEQDKRLKLCYCQALSIQEQLEAIISELLKFSGKQECSPTERTFCSKITERVQRADKEMKEFLIQPLKEVISENGHHFGSNSSTSGCSHSCPSGRSKAAFQTPGVLSQPRSMHPLKLQPGGQKASHVAANSWQSGAQAQPKARHIWSFSTSKAAEGIDYDRLAPPAATTGLETNEKTHCGTRDIKCGRRGKKSSDQSRIGDPSQHCLSSSAPATPILQGRVLKPSSSSDCLLAASSNIPIPTRRQSSKGSTQKPGDGSDIDSCSGSGDSGFCDPTEFSRIHPNNKPPFKRDHEYMEPVKHTMNEPSAYCVPVRRDAKH